jgi:hypothetical protein
MFNTSYIMFDLLKTCMGLFIDGSLAFLPFNWDNCIDGVMVNVLALSAIDRGFKPQSGQTIDYKVGICWFR